MVKREDQIDQHYQDIFDDTASSGPRDYYEDTNEPTDKLLEKESNPTNNSNSPWVNNTRFQKNNPAKQKSGGMNTLKKSGPMIGIVSILLGFAGIVSFFGGPGLLMVHMVETFTERFDFGMPGMHKVNMKILKSKVDNSTTGWCGKVVTARCKYASFGAKEIADLKAQGIEAIGNKSKLPGRIKPESFTFKDEFGKVHTISPQQFVIEMNDLKSNFRRKVHIAYSPNLARWSDKTFWKVAAKKLKIGKNRPFTGDEKSSSDRTARVKEITEKGAAVDVNFAEDQPCKDPNNCTAEEKDRNDQRKKVGDVYDKAKEYGASGKSAIGARLSGGLGTFSGAGNVCMIYESLKGFVLYSKTTRALQMARYAAMFFSVASAIKAGQGIDSDVSYFADKATQLPASKDVRGNTVFKSNGSATDSFGYRNAAYDDQGMTDVAMMFLAAGGAGGEVNKALTTLQSKVPGGKATLDSACGAVNSTAGSVVGMLSNFTVVGIAVNVIGGAAAGVLMTMLLPYLYDMISGVLIDESTVGEPIGDILATGYQKTSSENAGWGYQPPLKPEQAVPHMEDVRTTVLSYNQLDRDSRSPLDPYSPNTLVGSIVSALMPYSSKMRSVSGSATAMSSLVSQSLTNLIAPTARASEFYRYTAADYQSADQEYAKIKLATTKQGTPITGTTTELDNLDYNEVYKSLVGHVTYWEEKTDKGIIPHWYADPLIDWQTGEPRQQKSKQFVANCVERPNVPWDMTNEDQDVIWTAEECYVGGKLGATGVSINERPEPAGTPDPDGLMPDNDSDAAKNSPYVSDATLLRNWERNALYVNGQYLRTNSGREEEYPQPSSGNDANTSSGSTSAQDAGTAPVVAQGNAQELAKKIVASKNYDVVAKYASQIADIAKGESKCQVDVRILQMIATVIDKYSVRISSLNRFCTGTLTASGTGSLHYTAKGGHAVDFDMIDDRATTGGGPTATAFINDALKAFSSGTTVELGQVNCGQTNIQSPTGITLKRVTDSCNHIHMGVYP